MRLRRISVLRKSATRATTAKAETVGFANDFYLMGSKEKNDLPLVSIDQTWTNYEAGLNAALDRLVNREPIDHRTWLRVLVPFVVGTLCRGPAFADDSMAWSARMDAAGEVEFVRTSEDVNFARFMEVPRLLAPVMASRWVVMHLPPDVPSLTNDIGFAPMAKADNVVPGVAIPVARGAILAILPVQKRTVLMKLDGAWITPIEHATLTPASARDLAVRLARQARQFIVGPNAESVETLAHDLEQSGERSVSFFEATSLRHAAMRDLMFEWHRLVRAADQDALDVGPQQKFDWESCGQGWMPPQIVGVGEDTATGVEYDDVHEQLLLEMPADVLDLHALAVFLTPPVGGRAGLARRALERILRHDRHAQRRSTDEAVR